MKRKIASVSGALGLAAAVVVVSGTAAEAANPTCPTGSGTPAIVYNGSGVVGAKVCWQTDGDVFRYRDTASDGQAGGMFYYSNDGIEHDGDYTYQWDTRTYDPALPWLSLNQNIVEGKSVFYKACLRLPNAGGLDHCSASYTQAQA